jgi:hypothetical protein
VRVGGTCPDLAPKSTKGGRRRKKTSATPGCEHLEGLGVDPAHLVWPGGGEPHFPMQLCHVGYGHVATRHNPAGPPMSLWTPGGEHPVDRDRAPDGGSDDLPDDLSPEEQEQLAAMQAQMEQVQAQLLAAPAAVVVVNHAMGLYELAALHLMQPQPKLAEASVAIDALGALLDGMRGRLGQDEQAVRDALTQLRAAYLEVRSRQEGDTESSDT